MMDTKNEVAEDVILDVAVEKIMSEFAVKVRETEKVPAWLSEQFAPALGSRP